MDTNGIIRLLNATKNATRAMEEFCLCLQRMQPETIEMNRRLMKAGNIEFDEYEEIE